MGTVRVLRDSVDKGSIDDELRNGLTHGYYIKNVVIRLPPLGEEDSVSTTLLVLDGSPVIVDLDVGELRGVAIELSEHIPHLVSPTKMGELRLDSIIDCGSDEAG